MTPNNYCKPIVKSWRKEWYSYEEDLLYANDLKTDLEPIIEKVLHPLQTKNSNDTAHTTTIQDTLTTPQAGKIYEILRKVLHV